MKPNRSRFSRFREILMLQSRRPPTPLPANCGHWTSVLRCDLTDCCSFVNSRSADTTRSIQVAEGSYLRHVPLLPGTDRRITLLFAIA